MTGKLKAILFSAPENWLPGRPRQHILSLAGAWNLHPRQLINNALRLLRKIVIDPMSDFANPCIDMSTAQD